MPKPFIHEDFLLSNDVARTLYHEYAKSMPIFDYHCHLSPAEIAENRSYDNLTQVWLYGDHYKWRAMRTGGVPERLCTGDAGDWEKFQAWAQIVPQTLRNPLYHWTHLELKRYFGIDQRLSPETAKPIFEATREMLQTDAFRARGLMQSMKVKVVCTTDDPVDSLEHHRQIAAEGFAVKVLPTWRPDKAMAAENIETLNAYIDALGRAADRDISNYDTYLEALRRRHDYFHQMGCRLSDHGLETFYAEPYHDEDIRALFDKIRSRRPLHPAEQRQFKSALLHEFAVMDHEKGWTQQFHYGAMRNVNSRMFERLGPDTGFDSIGDRPVAEAASAFFDRLCRQGKLTKTILYNLNPRDNALLATMIGNYQDGTVPGKMQFGSGWWFLDQKDGMTAQINALSNMGLLSRFVGMLTDSRSFLSYPRHEYFRRILCDILGREVESGELPDEIDLLGRMVQDISFNNAKRYFAIDLDESAPPAKK
ncbi:MAG: glucuronate isomerase [Sedimentisphaerales bacterium]|nr:glucuronate isomerase [Sedimentisphaerales bacterium]